MNSPHWWSRNAGVETMAMPQRDDPPSRCALRRTSTIERRSSDLSRLRKCATARQARCLSLPSCMEARKRPSDSARSCASWRNRFDGRWRQYGIVWRGGTTMITRSELEQLLASTETYRVERIKFTTDKFGEAVCAFTNDMPF